ncbi:hypothetical protein scyTo_0010876, partial [Scyliorhinus torazame]|nr:hypothetical protein [Scyliorhinus torazame]
NAEDSHKKGTSNSMPGDAKIELNIPLPKDLDTVTPASTNYCDISTPAPRNEVSPDYLTLEPDNKREMVDIKQGSKLPSSQMVIDLTQDERCINNQSRKKESEIQTSVMTTDTRPSATQSDNGIDDDSVQMPLVSEAQPAKPQINVANIKPSQTLCVQILSIGGPMRGNNVMTENLKPADPMMDQQSQHPQVSVKSVQPAPLSKIQTTSDLPPEADNTSPPQKPELNLAQVRKPKGIALSWNITDVKQICAPVHSYQLYAYHEDPNLKLLYFMEDDDEYEDIDDEYKDSDDEYEDIDDENKDIDDEHNDMNSDAEAYEDAYKECEYDENSRVSQRRAMIKRW